MNWDGYIPLEEANDLYGTNIDSLKRLLRGGKLRGTKKLIEGRLCWLVERKSLDHYYNPTSGFAYDLPGPKPFLSYQTIPNGSFNQYWVYIHDYSVRTENDDFTVRCEAVIESSAHEAAQRVRHLFGRTALVVKIEKMDLTFKDDGEAILEF